MKNQQLSKSLSIVAAHYGDNLGVKVVFSNNHHDAHTDGKSITLPTIPENYPNKDALWGFLVHEAAHVKYSDFQARSSSELHRSLDNAIEDARIELAIMTANPGVRRDLNSAVSYAMDTAMLVVPTPEHGPANVLLMYILAVLRGRLLGQPCSVMIDPCAERMQETFPAGVFTRLGSLLRKVSSLQSSEDSSNLAGEIIAMLEQESEDDAPGETEQNTSSYEQGSSDSEDQDNQDDSDGEDQESDCASDSSQQSGQEGDAGEDDAQKKQAVKQALSASSEEIPSDIFDAMRDDLQQVATEARMNGEECAVSIPDASQTLDTVTGDGQALMAKAAAHSSRLRAQLMGLVQSSQLQAAITRDSGSRLDSRKLHRVMAGDMRIFKQRTIVENPNTAVHLLVDLSGSMHGYAEAVAKEAALSIALALEAIPGVSPAVTYFMNGSSCPVYVAMQHGQKAKRLAQKFDVSAGGSTPMTEAIWYSAYALSKCSEPKKQMFVITDGAPDHRASAYAAIQRCQNSGIDVFGIGVGGAAEVKNLFRHSIQINSVDELKTTLFSLFKSQLARAA